MRLRIQLRTYVVIMCAEHDTAWGVMSQCRSMPGRLTLTLTLILRSQVHEPDAQVLTAEIMDWDYLGSEKIGV